MFNNYHIPAILLILGFVSVIAASVIGPPKLYQESSVDRQLQLVADHQTAWIISNLFFGAAGLLTAAGLILFAWQIRGNPSVWIAALGAFVYTLGALAYAIFLYQRVVNPAALFIDYSFSPLTVILLAALVIGLILTGIAFLQVGFPAWLGVFTIAGMALIGGAALIFPTQFFNVFPPQALFLFTLMAGIVMWRQ